MTGVVPGRMAMNWNASHLARLAAMLGPRGDAAHFLVERCVDGGLLIRPGRLRDELNYLLGTVTSSTLCMTFTLPAGALFQRLRRPRPSEISTSLADLRLPHVQVLHRPRPPLPFQEALRRQLKHVSPFSQKVRLVVAPGYNFAQNQLT